MLNLYLIVVCVLISVLTYWWYRKPLKFPPGPKGLPLLGILPFLSAYPEHEFGTWSKKYGPLMSVPMGWQNWVVLNDYETIKETLLKRSEHFNERPKIRFLQMLSPNGLGFVPGGEIWRSHRRFGVAALRRFGGSKGVIERKVNEEALNLIEELKKYEGKPFQMENLLTNAVSNVICSIAFGRRFQYDDDKFRGLVSSLLAVFKMLGHWKTNLLMFIPFLCDVPSFSSHINEGRKLWKPVRDMIADLLIEHQSTFDPNDIRDIMDAYLECYQQKENNLVLEDLQDFFVDLFAGGTETTASSLRWAFLCLMIHQDVQEKMQEEIDTVIGKDGTPSLSLSDKLPYTCAVVHEILRFRTVAPLSLPRCVAKDVTVCGYNLPKGTKVLTNQWQVNNDEANWQNPSVFAPQRHLDENGNFTNSRHVLTFGAGARMCLGEQLARAENWLFLVTVIQRFRISVDPDDPDPPSLTRGSNAIVYIPDAYNMIIHSR